MTGTIGANWDYLVDFTAKTGIASQHHRTPNHGGVAIVPRRLDH